MDSVYIRRFKYLPKRYEIGSSSISDEVSKSHVGLLKMIFMTCAFFNFTFVECLKEKPDIMHGHWAFPGGVIAYIMSRIYKTKSIITIHGGEIQLLKKFKIIRKITVYSLNKSFQVLANSKYTKNELIKLGVKENNITVMKVPPNFVNHEFKREEIQKFKEKIISNADHIILFVGRLVERKGVIYLIKSMKEITSKNVHLVIVGGGEEFQTYQKLINNLNLKNNISLMGWISGSELGMLYKISDIFVCPSIIDSRGITEYLGLVIPEAMYSGLPVIATSVGGIVDTVQNEVNGLLVNQKDSKAIAKSIDRIISDEKLKKKIIENSKITVIEFFT